jgi:hypothetical protein
MTFDYFCQQFFGSFYVFPHQLPEIDMKFLNAYNLFAICDDYWGVLPMPFVLGGATFLL